jgi:low temperature requirement protein LtrA
MLEVFMLSQILQLRTSHTGHGDEQKVGWLELFYDLVYVATIIALGNKLSEDSSTNGVLAFAALFVPIWWTWTGMAFYMTRFNLDDVGHRLLVFAQMFAISVLAINVSDGLGNTSQGFALGYVGARAVLILMYLRAGQQRPHARVLTARYVKGFSLAALIWLTSAFVPEPARFVLWAVGLVIDFGTPLLPSTRRLQAEIPPDTHHLPERFGLFTIIVLGEAFIKVITSASGHGLGLSNVLYGVLALVIAASIWWMYFDNVKGSVVRRTRVAGQVWVYTHLPLLASITAYGVAAKKIVLLERGHALGDEKRLLVSGAVAVALFAIAILDLTHTESARDLVHNRLALSRVVGGIAILLIGLAGDGLSPGVLMALIALVCAAQIGADLFLEYVPVSRSPRPHSPLAEKEV